MSLDSILILLGIAVEVVLLIVALRRGISNRLPMFAVYVGWSAAVDLLFFVLPSLKPGDAVLRFVIQLSIDSLLQMLVLGELMWSTLKPVRASLPRGSVFAIPILLILIGGLCWPLAGFTASGNLSHNGHILVVLQQTVSLLRVVVFLVMVAFSHVLSIGWRDRELQIASGLGFYSILSLIVSVFHTHQVVGPQYHWLDLAASIGYLCTLTYWVVCFSIKEPERKKISPQMQHFLVTIGGAVQAERFALESAVGQNRGKNSSKRRNQ